MSKNQKIERALVAGAKKEGVSIREYANKIIDKIEEFASRHPLFKKVCMSIIALILVFVTAISLASCGNKTETIEFDSTNYTGIEEVVDGILDDCDSKVVLHAVSLDSFDVHADEAYEDSYVKINTTGFAGEKSDKKKITLTLNGTEANHELIKTLDNYCKEYYNSLTDESKTDNDRNKALNDYLSTAYNLVSTNKSDFKVETQSISSSEELKFDKADSVVSKVIAQVAEMNEEGEVDSKLLSQLAKLVSYGNYSHSGAVISSVRDRSSGITTIRYRVTSTCGDNSFSVDYVLTAHGNLTPEQIKGIVQNVINGKEYLEDVDVTMDTDSLSWTNAYHVLAWQNINSAVANLSAEK